MELDQARPQLKELIRQEDRRLAEGPRELVVALPHPTGIELATRIRLFANGAGLGVGVLRRRSQVLQPDAEGVSEEITYRALLEHTGFGLHDALGRSPRLVQGPETSRAATHALREALAEQLQVKQATACGHLLLW
jgi:hypothetical protein